MCYHNQFVFDFEFETFKQVLLLLPCYQGHPTDHFGGISVRKTCNRLKFSVREMSSRAFLINAFCFRRDDVSGTKIGQLHVGFSGRLQFP